MSTSSIKKMRQEADGSYQWDNSISDKIDYLPNSPPNNSIEAEISSLKVQYPSGSNLCLERLTPSPDLCLKMQQSQFGKLNFVNLRSENHPAERKTSTGSDISLVDSANSSLDGGKSDRSASSEINPEKYDDLVEGIEDLEFSSKTAINDFNGDEEGWKDSFYDDDDDDEDDDDDDDLKEKGPMKSQTNFLRTKPYYDYDWLEKPIDQVDYPTDIESTAKEIFSNVKFRYVINASLDKLNERNPNQRNCMNNEWSDENFKSFRGFNNTKDEISNSSITKIESNENYESLIDLLSNLQPAQSDISGNQNLSPAASSETWPDSLTSSPQIPSSRPQSRASSEARSPGSSTHMGSPNFSINLPSSPTRQRSCKNRGEPFSRSLSSDNCFGDASSPVNYQNALDLPSEDQLDMCFCNFSSWFGSCKSSGNNVNPSDDTINKIQMANDIIKNDFEEVQVVPKCQWGMKSSNIDNHKHEENMDHQQMCSPNSLTNVDRSRTINDIRNYRLHADFNNFGYEQNNYPNEMQSYLSDNGASSPEVFLDLETKMEDLISSNYLQQNIQNASIDNDQNSDNLNCRSSCNFDPNITKFHQGNVSQFMKNWEEEQPSTSKNHVTFNNFKIPTPILQHKSNNSNVKRNSPRSITPWPSLNIPKTSACEILKAKLDPTAVERAMKSLLKKSAHELSIPDEDGDTMLMCLVGNPIELEKKIAYLIPLVERLGTLPDALSRVNNKGENVLYSAAMNCPKMAYVTGYLAAIMIQKGIDINISNQIGGNNLIHAVSANGEEYKSVLSELLSLKNAQGNSVFDPSECNYNGKTPLHIAVEAHNPMESGKNSISIVRLLMENGADPRIKELKYGDTALHRAISMSCDSALIKVLLERNGRDAVNIPNQNNNTPLHMAAAISEKISVKIQKDICVQLIKAGGLPNIKNNQGLPPIALVSSHRKEIIRFFHSKS